MDLVRIGIAAVVGYLVFKLTFLPMGFVAFMGLGIFLMTKKIP
jgi:hypothetical protein